MIGSFRDKETERLFQRHRSRRLPPPIQRRALRKLMFLHAAASLDSIRAFYASDFEALKGDRTGQYSIRINRQWRICFEWRDGNAERVEITDYH